LEEEAGVRTVLERTIDVHGYSGEVAIGLDIIDVMASMIGRAPRYFPYVTVEDNHPRVFHIETTSCFEPEFVSSQFEGQLSCLLVEPLLHGKLHTKETPTLESWHK
jgi:hypothetical protein